MMLTRRQMLYFGCSLGLSATTGCISLGSKDTQDGELLGKHDPFEGFDYLSNAIAYSSCKPGMRWTSGPDGTQLTGTKVVTTHLPDLAIDSDSTNLADVKAALRGWKLNAQAEDQETSRLQLTGLKRHRVEDSYEINERGRILWEVITADRFSFQSHSTTQVSADVETPVPDTPEGTAEAGNTVAYNSQYPTGFEDDPPVIAVKVMDIQIESPRSKEVQLGEDEELYLGYKIRARNVDPLNLSLDISIGNVDLTIPEGHNEWQLTETNPWKNIGRTSSLRDRKAKKFDFVRDRIELTLVKPTRVNIVREYVKRQQVSIS